LALIFDIYIPHIPGFRKITITILFPPPMIITLRTNQKQPFAIFLKYPSP